MMKGGKDGGLAIILAGKAKKKPGADMGPVPKDEGEDEDSSEEGKTAAVEDFMSAVKSGDTQAAKDALQDFFDMCY
jgi:hypothetical protein